MRKDGGSKNGRKGSEAGHMSAEKEEEAFWVAYLGVKQGELCAAKVAHLSCISYPILYNSDMSCHIFSDRASFASFHSIQPQKIRIANNEVINTVGTGDMVVHGPNQEGVSRV